MLLLGILNYFSWNFLLFLKEGKAEVIFFDVGQGDAILIKTPQHHHILIDGGPGDILLEKLGRELPFFHNALDLVILTHPHNDHLSGLVEVMQRYRVDEILCTGVREDSKISQRWEKITKERGYRQARAGQRIYANDFYLDILYPTEDLRDKRVSDANTASVISRFSFKEYSFLFMGDAYKAQEKEIMDLEEKCVQDEGCFVFVLDSNVLKVGHHGSRTSTSEEFLQAVDPEFAVIMSGKKNPYGHPHQEVLDVLIDHGVNIRRTDQDGDIRFVIPERGVIY